MDELHDCPLAASYWMSKAGIRAFHKMLKTRIGSYTERENDTYRLIQLVHSLKFQDEQAIVENINDLIHNIAEEFKGKTNQTQLYTKLTTQPVGDMPNVWGGDADRDETEVEFSSIVLGKQNDNYSLFLKKTRERRK